MGLGAQAHIHYLTALLPYCPTALLPSCPTTLLLYCPPALLPHRPNERHAVLPLLRIVAAHAEIDEARFVKAIATGSKRDSSHTTRSSSRGSGIVVSSMWS